MASSALQAHIHRSQSRLALPQPQPCPRPASARAGGGRVWSSAASPSAVPLGLCLRLCPEAEVCFGPLLPFPSHLPGSARASRAVSSLLCLKRDGSWDKSCPWVQFPQCQADSWIGRHVPNAQTRGHPANTADQNRLPAAPPYSQDREAHGAQLSSVHTVASH